MREGDIVVVSTPTPNSSPQTISRLVRWFADPQVGAVAGNAKVGNRLNMLTRWQALEYITAQNLERRALATLGCITVVPGAVGAWRREAIVKLGGFPANTLAEDQDLTIMVQRAGYKVLFDQEAIAWTEAPDTMAGLAKQRFRWAFGTLQCLWKHRRVNLNPRYGALGLVAMPQVWMFQIALALVSPLIDLALIYQILRTLTDYLQHGEQFNSEQSLITATYYAVFMTVDLTAAMIAFFLRKRRTARCLVACPAAVRLPADHVLRGGEVGAEGLAGPRRRLGQARAKSHGQNGSDSRCRGRGRGGPSSCDELMIA